MSSGWYSYGVIAAMTFCLALRHIRNPTPMRRIEPKIDAATTSPSNTPAFLLDFASCSPWCLSMSSRACSLLICRCISEDCSLVIATPDCIVLTTAALSRAGILDALTASRADFVCCSYAATPAGVVCGVVAQ